MRSLSLELIVSPAAALVLADQQAGSARFAWGCAPDPGGYAGRERGDSSTRTSMVS